jgi:hypothetical protein
VSGTISSRSAPEGSIQIIVGAETAALPLQGVIDFAAERARLEKEIAKCDSDIAHVDQKLGNPNFVSRAPEELVDEERGKRNELEARKTKFLEALRRLTQPVPQPSEKDGVVVPKARPEGEYKSAEKRKGAAKKAATRRREPKARAAKGKAAKAKAAKAKAAKAKAAKAKAAKAKAAKSKTKTKRKVKFGIQLKSKTERKKGVRRRPRKNSKKKSKKT